MSTPVTRGELRVELEQLETRFEQKLEQLETRFEQKLERLETRLEQKLERLEIGFEQKLETWGQRLLTELARHTKAIEETLSAQVSVVDEKYADLPGRVKRLETMVLGPKRRG